MVEELMAVSGQSGIRNVKVVASPWESAQAKPADVVLCAHVLYGVEDIGTFVRKLNSHARKTVLIVMFLDAPQSHHSQFWKRLHGEERVTLPALKELPPVLWELGIYPNVEMLDAMPPPSYDEREEALHDLRFRLYVAPGSEKDACLLQAIDELLIRTEDGLTLKDTTPRRLGLVRWGKI
ncbi:MAG: hypothetical protein FJ317_04805 [SAR202 cluster bacterium]|nr:hypothetical protein [SAR202 cluster bacterium]